MTNGQYIGLTRQPCSSDMEVIRTPSGHTGKRVAVCEEIPRFGTSSCMEVSKQTFEEIEQIVRWRLCESALPSWKPNCSAGHFKLSTDRSSHEQAN